MLRFLPSVPLREKLGEDGADALIGVLNQLTRDNRAFVKEEFEHRDRLAMIDQKISAFKTDLIKWMFILSIGNVAIMSGILYTMLKLMVT